jgi:hypothetical protein
MRWTSLTGIVALTFMGCAGDPDPRPPIPPIISGFFEVAFLDHLEPAEDRFRSLLQAELQLAKKLVDRGAPLRSDEIDVLIAAEDALYAYDQDIYGALLPEVQEYNANIEIPCDIREPETLLGRI